MEVDHRIAHLSVVADDPRADAERLASGHLAEIGAAVASRDRIGETVLAIADAGGSPDDVMAGLVMAGLAQRVTRLRDRLPGRRKQASPMYKLLDRSHLSDYPE